MKKEPERLMRKVASLTAAYVWKHPMLWGQSMEDICEKALEAVWEAGARTPQQAERAVYAALASARDAAKANRARLEPYQVRKAEKKAASGTDAKGRSPEAARQAAFGEFVEDCALFSQRSSFRDFDKLRVRAAIRTMSEEDRKFWKDYKANGASVSAVAAARGIAPTTFRRDFWEGFRRRFRVAWENVDVEKLAREVSSNPYVLAGR